jgi:intergrase/recombinase
MKKIVTLYVEEQLIQDGKAKGLNLSKFLESKLREFVSGSISLSDKHDSGMHQTIPAFSKHKRDYENWLISQGLSYGYIKDLTKTLTGFIREAISDIADNITDTQSIAARSYLNYLSQKSLLSDEQVARFKKKLPLKQSKADNYIPSNNEVVSAYKQLKDKRFQTIFKILAFSGARITELVKMVKEYEPSKLIVEEKFAKYQLHYNRGHKSSFYIYMPKEMMSELHKFYIHVDTITHQISKSGLNPKYLRKWFYNFLIYNNVPEGVADFIEGRASATVGSMHYLSKAKQADYWYEQIVDGLKSSIIG